MPNMTTAQLNAKFAAGAAGGPGLDDEVRVNFNSLTNTGGRATIKKTRICEFAAQFPARCVCAGGIGGFTAILNPDQLKIMANLPAANPAALTAIVATSHVADAEVAANAHTLAADLVIIAGRTALPAQLAADVANRVAHARFDAHRFGDQADLALRLNAIQAIDQAALNAIGNFIPGEREVYEQLLADAVQLVLDQQTAVDAIAALHLPAALEQARLDAINAAPAGNQGRNAQAEQLYRDELAQLRQATEAAIVAAQAAVQAQLAADRQTSADAIIALHLPAALEQARLDAIVAAIANADAQGRNPRAEQLYRAELDRLRQATVDAIAVAQAAAQVQVVVVAPVVLPPVIVPHFQAVLATRGAATIHELAASISSGVQPPLNTSEKAVAFKKLFK